jgi:hypothetical protein
MTVKNWISEALIINKAIKQNWAIEAHFHRVEKAYALNYGLKIMCDTAQPNVHIRMKI